MSMTSAQSSRSRRRREQAGPSDVDGDAAGTERRREPAQPDGDTSGALAVAQPAKPERRGADRKAPAPVSYDKIPVELAEALRGIINRTELREGRPLPQAIAVTSAVRGEGVSTLSRSLATIIASEMGRFVCWIDCSWLSGDDGGDQPDRPSLVEILADDSRMESAFETTPELPSLVSLSPGPVPAAQRNLIARSPEFEHMLDLLQDEFDHLIFDLPPVLSHANTIGLLRQADASILVVRHRSTSVAQVDRAIEAMRPTPNLAVILNQYRSSIPKRIQRLLGG